MIVLYGVILIGFIVLFIISKSYKKELIKKLNIKEHPLKILYGIVMFIEDKIICKLKIFNNKKMVNSLKTLYIKEKMEEITYLIKTKNFAVCLSVFIVFIIIGFSKCINDINVSQFVQTLNRPEYGEGSKNYDLEARIEGEDETLQVHVEIDEVKYTNEEINLKIDNAYEELLTIFLGENKAQDEITKNLNFVNKIEDVIVSWDIENTNLVDYNGNIFSENVVGEGEMVYLTAVLSFDKMEKEFEIPIVIKATGKYSNITFEEKIQNSIDDTNSKQDEKVILPTKVDEKEVLFFNASRNQGGVFFILAVISGITVLFAQNKELNNKVKKRNDQMLNDYAEIVSKLTLLSEAGLSIKICWNRIVEDYEKSKNNKVRYAYEEMRLTNIKMKNGTPEALAYEEFGKRCNLQSYLKLGGLLEQNITKGTKGLKLLLEKEVKEAFEARKNQAKIRGEEAGTKLLFPMILMLLVVIIIIVVPAFLSMNL